MNLLHRNHHRSHLHSRFRFHCLKEIKRTKYGEEVLGKIRGFRTFLMEVKKEELENIVEKDIQNSSSSERLTSFLLSLNIPFNSSISTSLFPSYSFFF